MSLSRQVLPYDDLPRGRPCLNIVLIKNLIVLSVRTLSLSLFFSFLQNPLIVRQINEGAVPSQGKKKNPVSRFSEEGNGRKMREEAHKGRMCLKCRYLNLAGLCLVFPLLQMRSEGLGLEKLKISLTTLYLDVFLWVLRSHVCFARHIKLFSSALMASACDI